MIPSRTRIIKIGLNYCVAYKSTKVLGQKSVLWDQSLVLIFLMTCKALGSPDGFSSRTQPRYVTLWYWLICIVPYLISKLRGFSVSFLYQTVYFYLVLSSPKWILSLLSTNQLQTCDKFLLIFCSITLISLYWYIKHESSA